MAQSLFAHIVPAVTEDPTTNMNYNYIVIATQSKHSILIVTLEMSEV